MDKNLWWWLLGWVYCFMAFNVASAASLPDNGVQQALEEQQQTPKAFSLLMYHPNYFLPLTLSSSASQSVQSDTPDAQNLQPIDISFQLSFKVPLWQPSKAPNTTLFVAYTQLSYWEAYNQSPFFRETNYQPEIFVNQTLKKSLWHGWSSEYLQAGLIHQSNGEGGTNERTWNRLYAAAVFSHHAWLLNIEPWYVVPGASFQEHNADIAHYLGYGQVLAAYKLPTQTLSLTSYGFDAGWHRTTGILTWSMPMSTQINVYALAFSGYGQTLLEYNHHMNSIGIGVSLNDWL